MHGNCRLGIHGRTAANDMLQIRDLPFRYRRTADRTYSPVCGSPILSVSTGSVWNRSVLDDGFACRSARSEILNFRDLQNRNGHRLFRAAFFGDFDLFVIDGVIGMQHDVARKRYPFFCSRLATATTRSLPSSRLRYVWPAVRSW